MHQDGIVSKWLYIISSLIGGAKGNYRVFVTRVFVLLCLFTKNAL